MIILQVRGGLGNQMFEYAFVRNLSIANNNEKIYLYTENFKYDDLREYALKHLCLSPNIKVINKSKCLCIYRKIFSALSKMCKIAEDNQKDVLKLYKFGYLQYLGNNDVINVPNCYIPIKYYSSVFLNKKYFIENEDIIRQELLVNTPPSKENREWINKISSMKESVCIHIRRGDYVQKDKYLVCTENYYKVAVEKCVEIIKENPTFFVFSEDIEYAKSLRLAEKNIFYVDLDNPDYEELRLMYHCKHFIISNSTFSWWAQYLAKDRGIVIAPKYWNKEEKEISYMNEKDWILL